MKAVSSRNGQLLAVGLGLLLCALMTYQHNQGADLLSTTNTIGDQTYFERLLLRAERGVAQFRNIVVHPYARDTAQGEMVVTGDYYDGGSPSGRRLCFAASTPFKPLLLLDGRGAEEARAHYATLKKPTILDYLEYLHGTAGVTYSYAWWEDSRTIRPTWVLASALVVGGLSSWLFGVCCQLRLPSGSNHDDAPDPASPAPARVETPRAAPGGLPGLTSDAAAGWEARVSAPELDGTTSLNVPGARPASFVAKPDDYYPTQVRGAG